MSGEINQDKSDPEMQQIMSMIKHMTPEQRTGVAWFLKNFEAVERLLNGGRLTVREIDAFARTAAYRNDYRMLCLLLYMQYRTEEENDGGYFRLN